VVRRDHALSLGRRPRWQYCRGRRRPEIDTDYTFFSLDNLDFALGTSLEARKGRWGMLYDAMYVEFSDAFERSPGSEVEVSGGFVETLGSMTASNGRPLELLFGLRYVALKATVDVAPIARHRAGSLARPARRPHALRMPSTSAGPWRCAATSAASYLVPVVGARDECVGHLRLAHQRQAQAARRLSHAANGFRRRRLGARRDLAGLRRRSELDVLTPRVGQSRENCDALSTSQSYG
jgi:hypothetical protein